MESHFKKATQFKTIARSNYVNVKNNRKDLNFNKNINKFRKIIIKYMNLSKNLVICNYSK